MPSPHCTLCRLCLCASFAALDRAVRALSSVLLLVGWTPVCAFVVVAIFLYSIFRCTVATVDTVLIPPPLVFLRCSCRWQVVYVAPDELVEVTPAIVRLRKRILDPEARDKFNRTYAKAMKDLE